MRKRLPLTLLAAPLALLLAACLFDTKETRVAGGAEDFPNTFAALGGATAGNLAAQGEWDQFGNIPAIDFAGADTLVIEPPAKRGAGGGGGALAKGEGTDGKALAKGAASLAAAAAPDTTWDYSDTASRGIARRFIRDETLRHVRTDTTVIRWDDKARDGVAGNELLLEQRGGELLKLSLRLSAYRYENLDSADGFDRATFYDADRREKGVHHRLIIVKPGADGDFATRADNRPVYFATARTLGGDTLDAFEVIDADGDGQLWGDNDSGLVDARHRQTDPESRPQVASSTQRLRAVLFRQAGRTYPISYTETRVDRDGRKVTFAVKGPRGGSDSTFGPGDTVTVTVKTVPSPEAESRFAERTGRYLVRLSPQPGAFGGNLLLRFSMETRWREGAFRRGKVVSTRLVFIPEIPAAPGIAPVTGEVRLEAAFADGTEATLEGRFADRRIAADLVELRRADRVARYKVVWQADEEGTVLSQEPLPD